MTWSLLLILLPKGSFMNFVTGKIVRRAMVWALVCMFSISSSVLPLRGAKTEITTAEDSSVSEISKDDSSSENSNDEKGRSLLENGVRYGLAFSATSFIKGLFGMAPGYLATFLPSMGASMFVPALIGAGLLEGLISLSVFSAITGVKDRKWLTRSFLVASVVSVAATFFLAGMVSPLALTLITNGLRLAVFAMLTRPSDTSVADYIVEEVKDVVGVESSDDNELKTSIDSDSQKSALTITEIEALRLESYSAYIKASDSNERTKYYNDFKVYSELVNHFREDASLQEYSQ